MPAPDIQSVLHRFLILQKQLHLPGIGTFRLEREPADIDFAGKQVKPPVYSMALHHGNGIVPRKLYQFLAVACRISESEAVIRFNDFIFDLKQRINSGSRQEWPGIGSLSKGLAGEIRFQPDTLQPIASAIPAVKVIRENAPHQVRVGEDERSSAEMIELLQETSPRRHRGWILVWSLILLALLFLAWYFYGHQLVAAATGNQSVMKPAPEVKTRIVLP